MMTVMNKVFVKIITGVLRSLTNALPVRRIWSQLQHDLSSACHSIYGVHRRSPHDQSHWCYRVPRFRYDRSEEMVPY